MNKRPGGALHKASDTASKSQIFPLLSKGSELTQKAYLFPALTTVAFVVAMFFNQGSPRFSAILAGFLAFAAYYVIYRLCGKTKPWWLLAIVALSTAILIASPLLALFIFVFREVLPGSLPTGEEAIPIYFVHELFGAGLMEELFKALPVLCLAWLGGRAGKSWQVLEPLDGILLGAASGIGFTLMETLGEYVPQYIDEVANDLDEGFGQWMGLQLLIPRIIGSLFGHMAYSGYFGYFIGLSVLRPTNRWSILGMGYLTAALVHALWNTSDMLGAFAQPGLVVSGGIAYALLAAAILKARQISPSQAVKLPDNPVSFSLRVAGRDMALHPGTTIRQSDLPGFSGSATNGIVAVVDHSPCDPSVFGLKNLSQNTWRVTMADGNGKAVAPGKSIRLAAGSTLDFGGAAGKIR